MEWSQSFSFSLEMTGRCSGRRCLRPMPHTCSHDHKIQHTSYIRDKRTGTLSFPIVHVAPHPCYDSLSSYLTTTCEFPFLSFLTPFISLRLQRAGMQMRGERENMHSDG